MRRLDLLLICLLVGGCASRADQVFAANDVLTGTSGAVPGYGLKRVEGKQGNAEVVGDDGSVCRLTRERFQRIKVGQWLSCNWTIAPDTVAVDT